MSENYISPVFPEAGQSLRIPSSPRTLLFE